MLRRFQFTVWDEPKPLGRARFARLPGGKVRTYTQRKDQDVRFNIRAAFLSHPDVVADTYGDGDGFKPLTGPLRLTMIAYLPMPRNIPKKRRMTALPAKRPDLDNYVKQVEDALQGYAFVDDAQIVSIEARKRYAGQATVQIPCWEVILDEIEC